MSGVQGRQAKDHLHLPEGKERKGKERNAGEREEEREVLSAEQRPVGALATVL